MIITITAIFLIALVGLIIWAEIKGYDIDLAVIDGFFYWWLVRQRRK
jgi:hypothetical protein